MPKQHLNVPMRNQYRGLNQQIFRLNALIRSRKITKEIYDKRMERLCHSFRNFLGSFDRLFDEFFWS